MEFLPLILDGILILIFISFIVNGRRKGFVKTVLSLAATVISILVAKEYSPEVAQWVNDNFIHEMGVKWLTNIISDNIASGTQAVVGAIPQTISEAVTAFANTDVETLVSGVAGSEQVAVVAEKIYTAAELAFILTLISVVAFIAVFAISNAILSIVVSLVNTVAKLPVIKRLNKLLGGLLGAIKGAVGISVICALLVNIGALFAGTPLQLAVDDSHITQFVWDLLYSIS